MRLTPLALAIGLLSMSGCTLIGEFGECQTTDQCSEKYGPHFVCGSVGICERQTREDVIDETLCPFTFGNVEREDAQLVGVLLPLSGTFKGLGDPVLFATEVAVEDINDFAPPNSKPLALVLCDTRGETAQARAAAEHLADVVDAQAIIGPFTSASAFRLGTDLANRDDIVFITPTASSSSLTSINDNGVMWRTAVTDDKQGAGMAKVLEHMMTDVFAPADPTTDPLNVAFVVNVDDLYAQDLRESFNQTISRDVLDIDDSSNDQLERILYSDSTASALSSLQALDPRPDIVVFFGATESWEVLLPYDAAVSTASTNPKSDTIYLMPDLGKDIQRAERADVTLYNRIWGTQLEENTSLSYAPYARFSDRFEQKYFVTPEKFPYASNAFDAVYALAIAMEDSDSRAASIKANLSRIAPNGTATVEADPEGLAQAYATVRSGGTVTLQGASGDIGFDAATGDLTTTRSVVLWCFDEERFAQQDVIFDGMTFTPGTCE